MVEGGLEIFYFLWEVEIKYPLAFELLILVGHILLPFWGQQDLAGNLNIIPLQMQSFKGSHILPQFLIDLEQGRISDQGDRDVVERIHGQYLGVINIPVFNLFIVDIFFAWLFDSCEIEERSGIGWREDGLGDCYFRGDAEERVSYIYGPALKYSIQHRYYY